MLFRSGPDAAAFLSYALISNMETVKNGKAKYSMIVAEDGGIIDDLISYRFSDTKFLVVPNAGNTDVVWEAFNQRIEGFDVKLNNESLDVAMIALQGPNAAKVLVEQVAEESKEEVENLPYYAATMAKVADVDTIVARTGYTGEDGFELMIYNADATKLWQLFIDQDGVTPCGLASRDSLRLEAGMPLYGNELSRDITPVEAGMGVAFKKKTADFVGAEILRQRLEEGPKQVIRALTSSERRAARTGAEIYAGEQLVGTVTSGQPSPTLGHPIALALVDTAANLEEGAEVEVDIRGKRYPFTVTKTPFYSREK